MEEATPTLGKVSPTVDRSPVVSRPLVAILLLLSTALLPAEARGQADGDAPEAWRGRLAAIAPGSWIASNATWEEEDRSAERYGPTGRWKSRSPCRRNGRGRP